MADVSEHLQASQTLLLFARWVVDVTPDVKTRPQTGRAFPSFHRDPLGRINGFKVDQLMAIVFLLFRLYDRPNTRVNEGTAPWGNADVYTQKIMRRNIIFQRWAHTRNPYSFFLDSALILEFIPLHRWACKGWIREVNRSRYHSDHSAASGWILITRLIKLTAGAFYASIWQSVKPDFIQVTPGSIQGNSKNSHIPD